MAEQIQWLRVWLGRFVGAPVAVPLECGDLSPLCAGDLSPSNMERRPIERSRRGRAFARAAERGAAGPPSRSSTESGDKSPHSKAPPARLSRFVSAPVAVPLECGDLSPLCAGDWSPSNLARRPIERNRRGRAFARAAERGAAEPTSRSSAKSGDKSPHSETPAARRSRFVTAPVAVPLECGDLSPLCAGDLVLL